MHCMGDAAGLRPRAVDVLLAQSEDLIEGVFPRRHAAGHHDHCLLPSAWSRPPNRGGFSLDSPVGLSAPAKNGGSDLSTRTSEAIASNASIALAVRSRLLETSVSNKACRAWFLALRVRFADIDRDPDIAALFARASGLADGPETIRRV